MHKPIVHHSRNRTCKLKNKKVLLRERKIAAYQVLPEVGYPHQGTPWPGPTGGTQGGVLPIGVPPHWGTPRSGLMGGTQGLMWGVLKVGYPPSGYPPVRSDRGYLRYPFPLSGYPPARSDRGIPEVGYTQLDLAGVPPRCGQTDGWMD